MQPSSHYATVPYPKNYPHMAVWHHVSPESTHWGTRNLQSTWNVKAIYVTDNGCSEYDVPTADGKVCDSDRIMLIRACLTRAQRATAEGVPVRGYFQWSILDNFEWVAGYTNRYRLVYVGFATRIGRRS